MTKKKGKGAPPVASNNNLTKPAAGDQVTMNFKVDREFSRDFKLFATMHDMKYIDLLKACFDQYKNSKGN